MAALDPRYEPGAIPPDVPINSKGMPYSPDLDTMSPQEKANVAASMAAIKANGGLEPSRGAPAAAQPSTPAPAKPATVQSEPTPPPRPALDPRPYAWFKQNDPTVAGWIDKAAEETGASPQRLAVHKWLESGNGQTSKRGADGEIGVMQIMPATWKGIDPKGQLDPNDGQQAMLLAGTLINQLDGKYGKDSPLSVARYNGSGPAARAYAQRAFGPLHDSAFHDDPGTSTPQGLVKAGADGGPDAFMKYMVDTAPKTLGMTDKWRNAEALLVGAAIRKGDLAGAQAARDFVTSMAFGGTNRYLMAAHQALTVGQGVTAAQLLAKAHAFFPDGTVGRFSSNGTQVHAERVDENNPSISYGASPITPDSVLALLNQTSDPQKYLHLVAEQQKSQSNAFMAQAHGNFYAQRPQLMREQMANQTLIGQGHDQTRLDAANMHGQNALNIAQFNADQSMNRTNTVQAHADYRAGLRANGAGGGAVDKYVNNALDPTVRPNDANRGRNAVVLQSLMQAGMPGPAAEEIMNGLAANKYDFRASPDGAQVGLFDKSGKGSAPIALIPSAMLQKFAGPLAAQPRQMAAPPPLGGPTPGMASGAPTRPNPFVNAPTAAGGNMPMNALQYAMPSPDDNEED